MSFTQAYILKNLNEFLLNKKYFFHYLNFSLISLNFRNQTNNIDKIHIHTKLI
jgi:hypothetical protein